MKKTTQPLLVVENLAIETEAKQALVKGVSFSLAPGETLALVGESGSGKTLTALAVMGLLPEGLKADIKTLTFQGTELGTASAARWRSIRGRHMAMIFQEPATALNPLMTCGAQVEEMFAIHTPAMPKAERRSRTMALLRDVQLPDPARMARSYPHEISGGQRQRIMIAMALAHRPALLIADEPTTALDVTVQAEILKLVKALQKKYGMAMLWITHDFGVVAKLADRVLVMNKGLLVESGTVAAVLKKPKAPYTKALLGATLLLNPKPPALPRTSGAQAPLLNVEKLGHSYRLKGGWFWQKPQLLTALQNVNFTLPAGATLGVVGESGSGKSTLARVLTRLQGAAAGGRVVFMGQDVLGMAPKLLRLARRDMQMVFQDPVTSLNPAMTVFDALAEPIRAHRLLPESALAPRIAELLTQVGLPPACATRMPHAFSGGQRQRIAIARALALNPKLIIADEPVSALDVSVQAQILALFERLQQDLGTSYVFISHDLRVISHLAHQVLVLRHGKVVEYGPTQQVFGKPKAAYTRELLQAVI